MVIRKGGKGAVRLPKILVLTVVTVAVIAAAVATVEHVPVVKTEGVRLPHVENRKRFTPPWPKNNRNAHMCCFMCCYVDTNTDCPASLIRAS